MWEYERKELNDIGNLQDLDNEKFWRLLNNKACRNNKKNKKMLLEVNGKIITDSQQMADLWANDTSLPNVLSIVFPKIITKEHPRVKA